MGASRAGRRRIATRSGRHRRLRPPTWSRAACQCYELLGLRLQQGRRVRTEHRDVLRNRLAEHVEARLHVDHRVQPLREGRHLRVEERLAVRHPRRAELAPDVLDDLRKVLASRDVHCATLTMRRAPRSRASLTYGCMLHASIQVMPVVTTATLVDAILTGWLTKTQLVHREMLEKVRSPRGQRFAPGPEVPGAPCRSRCRRFPSAERARPMPSRARTRRTSYGEQAYFSPSSQTSRHRIDPYAPVPYRHDVVRRLDGARRIAAHHDEVCELPGREHAAVVLTQQLRCALRRDVNRLNRR